MLLSTDHYDRLKLIASDPALSEAFRAQYPDLQSLFRDASTSQTYGPLPAVSEITALQVSIFDNWPTGRAIKSKPFRYAAALHGWTAPSNEVNFAAREWQIRATATLFTPSELIAKAEGLQSPKLRNPISPEYAELLVEVARDSKGLLVGPLMYKSPDTGTAYFEYQLVRIDADALKGRTSPWAHLVLGAEGIELPAFSRADAAGRALRGGAILQSRYSPDGQFPGWVSGKICTSTGNENIS